MDNGKLSNEEYNELVHLYVSRVSELIGVSRALAILRSCKAEVKKQTK